MSPKGKKARRKPGDDRAEAQGHYSGSSSSPTLREKDRFIAKIDTNTDASNKSKVKSDTSVSLSDNKGTSFNFDITGEYLNITKNKGYDYNMRVSLIQFLRGKSSVLAKLNGKLSVQSNVKVEKPQFSEEIDIFTATEEDMKKLMEEIQKNIESIAKTFMPGFSIPGRN